MSTTSIGPIHNHEKEDDDAVAEPKAGGYEKPGAGKEDDDAVAEPKAGGYEKTSS